MITAADNPERSAGLVLLTRPECGLCEEMHAALNAVRARAPLPPLAVVDVDADPLLRRRWGLKIPVLLLEGIPVCCTRLDEQALREALAQAARAHSAGAAMPVEPRR